MTSNYNVYKLFNEENPTRAYYGVTYRSIEARFEGHLSELAAGNSNCVGLHEAYAKLDPKAWRVELCAIAPSKETALEIEGALIAKHQKTCYNKHKNPAAKYNANNNRLTQADVLEIVKLKGVEIYKDIGKRFGISRSMVSYICSGRDVRAHQFDDMKVELAARTQMLVKTL